MAKLTEDALAHLGVNTYPSHRPDEQRITVRVIPDKIIYDGGRPSPRL